MHNFKQLNYCYSTPGGVLKFLLFLNH